VNPFTDQDIGHSEESSSHHTMAEYGEQQLEIFEFPIQETNEETRMKNINPYALSLIFMALLQEDPDTFLFLI
jgi:hypothetical protein